MIETIQVFRVKSISARTSYIENDLSNVFEMLKDCPDGDGYIVTALHMPKEEYYALPEFTGF